MAFMGGPRNTTKPGGKSRASQELKERMLSRAEGLPELTNEQKYKRALQERMDQAMEDYLLGKKKNRGGPKNAQGELEAPEAPLSKTKQMMVKMMQMKKEARNRKELKKRENDFLREKRNKKWEENKLKMEEDARIQRINEEAARLAQENGNSGWW